MVPPTRPDGARQGEAALENMEQLLHYFHVDCKVVVASMDEYQRLACLSNVSVDAAEAMAMVRADESKTARPAAAPPRPR